MQQSPSLAEHHMRREIKAPACGTPIPVSTKNLLAKTHSRTDAVDLRQGAPSPSSSIPSGTTPTPPFRPLKEGWTPARHKDGTTVFFHPQSGN